MSDCRYITPEDRYFGTRDMPAWKCPKVVLHDGYCEQHLRSRRAEIEQEIADLRSSIASLKKQLFRIDEAVLRKGGAA